jgi:hypothetical protein
MAFTYPDHSRDTEGRSSLKGQTLLENFNIQESFEKHLLYLWFVVPCIFKYSNKTPNQMQQLIVKFTA